MKKNTDVAVSQRITEVVVGKISTQIFPSVSERKITFASREKVARDADFVNKEFGSAFKKLAE